MKQRRYDVIVVGAGAAGLMAAISAANAGARTAILDHHVEPAKKILATGNGKCNFTNEMQGESSYRCDTPAFVLQILKQFSMEDTVAFFESNGVFCKNKNGYFYPRSGQAAAIRNVLLQRADQLKVERFQEIGIRSITQTKDGFFFDTKSGSYVSASCILATGGKAAPKTGSDGSGYIYAKSFGHTLHTPLPALTALLCDAPWLKSTAGVRADAKVSLSVDSDCAAADCGEVQFTDYGLSGIPVFQVSRYASQALHEKKPVLIQLDLFWEYDPDFLLNRLMMPLKQSGQKLTWEQLLSGIMNEKLAMMFCRKRDLCGKTAGTPKSARQMLTQLVHDIKQLTVPVTDVKGFSFAQVTCGGIPTAELSGRMESRLVPDLYFAGEMVDVDGICGGYNLQWAWSSGYVAGKNAASRRLK